MMKNRYLKNLNVGDKVKNTLTYISAFSSILEDKIVQKSAERLFQHYHLVWIYSGDKILIRCQKPREQTYNGKIFDSALEIRAEDYNSPFKFKSGTVSEIFNSDKKPVEKFCSNFTDLISGFVPEFKPYANVINQSIDNLTSTKDPEKMSKIVTNMLTDIKKVPNDSTKKTVPDNGDINNDKETLKLVTDVYNTLKLESSDKQDNHEVTITNESDDEDYEVIFVNNIDNNNTNNGKEEQESTTNDKKEEVVINNFEDLTKLFINGNTEGKDFKINEKAFKDNFTKFLNKFNIDIDIDLTELEDIINKSKGNRIDKMSDIKNLFEKCNKNKTSKDHNKGEIVINKFEDLTKLLIGGNIGKDFKINEKSFKDDLTKFLKSPNFDPVKLLNNFEDTIKQSSEDKKSNIKETNTSGDTNVNKETNNVKFIELNSLDDIVNTIKECLGNENNNVNVIELNTLDDVVNLFKEFSGNGTADKKKDNSIVNTILDYVEKYCNGDNLYNKLGSFQDLLTNDVKNEINKNWFDKLLGLGPINISSEPGYYYKKDMKTNKKKKNNKEKAKQLRIKAGMLDPIPFYKLNLPAELITELEHYQEDLKVLGFEYFYIGHTDKLIDNFSKYYDNSERKYKTSEDKFTVKINIENSGKSYPDVYILVEMNKNNNSYMNVIPY